MWKWRGVGLAVMPPSPSRHLAALVPASAVLRNVEAGEGSRLAGWDNHLEAGFCWGGGVSLGCRGKPSSLEEHPPLFHLRWGCGYHGWMRTCLGDVKPISPMALINGKRRGRRFPPARAGLGVAKLSDFQEMPPKGWSPLRGSRWLFQLPAWRVWAGLALEDPR